MRFDWVTEKDLRRALAIWQKRLRLQDWDIQVYVVRQRQLDGRWSHAEVDVQRQHKIARISIAEGRDLDPKQEIPFNPEHSLVHELIELHFDPFKSRKRGRVFEAQEIAINLLAGALVETGRVLTDK